jgi:hypothetical protein
VFGDVNCDGVLDINDARQLNEQFGIEETIPCSGDVNRDGVVDGMDLGVVLGAWGLPCEVPGSCGDGVCDDFLEDPASCPRDCDCVESFSVTGSTDLDGDGISDLCYTDGTGYFSFQWNGGCLATALAVEYGGEEPAVYDLTDNEFSGTAILYGQGEYVCYEFTMTFEDGRTASAFACTDCGTGECGDGTCNPNEDANSCLVDCFCGDGICSDGEDVTSCPADCPACPAGSVKDCDGSGDCHFESWLGDGYCDGTAQQYSVDFCCYDLDGGDCSEAECSP